MTMKTTKTKTKRPPKGHDYTKRVDPVDEVPEEGTIGLGATDEETIERVMSGRVRATTWGML